MSTILPIAKAVITDKRVLGTMVAVLLYINFASFITKYHKKPPVKRVRKVVTPKPPVKKAEENSEESESSEKENSDKKTTQ